RYRVACGKRGEQRAGNASMVDWEHLSAALRRSCRNQAADVGRKLRAIGCTLAPRVTPGEDFDLTDDKVELLARMEQHRWMTERAEDGWTYGPARDEAARRHPDLTQWELLSTVAQAKNRDAMREFADIIADAGFRIVQL
ncbi:MAG TPA: RyR domain-containing protein, partial [Pseudonocardiaceae bacterium]